MCFASMRVACGAQSGVFSSFACTVSMLPEVQIVPYRLASVGELCSDVQEHVRVVRDDGRSAQRAV